MTLLSRWLSRDLPPAPTATDLEIERLARQAEGATPEHRSHLFTQAGDLCLRVGDRGRALYLYGRAVDSLLAQGYYDTAARMCRRIIQIDPQVVRARCTLAFLSLGRGMAFLPFHGTADEARREIGAYVEAAERRGEQAIAIRRLHLMADVAESEEVREVIDGFLRRLGDEAPPRHPALRAPEAQRTVWRRVLESAIMDVDLAAAS